MIEKIKLFIELNLENDIFFTPADLDFGGGKIYRWAISIRCCLADWTSGPPDFGSCLTSSAVFLAVVEGGGGAFGGDPVVGVLAVVADAVDVTTVIEFEFEQ